jgi:hypothetical protein
MGSSVVDDRARAGEGVRGCASVPPDPETILGLAAELLDPVLQPLGFLRGAPGHWTSTRFAWHEDVLVEVESAAGSPGPASFTVEIFAGVPRRGIGDPVPGTPFARALDPTAREGLRRWAGRVGRDEDVRFAVRDDADLRMWLAFIGEHLPSAIARVRGHGWRQS